jgi:hypothetical protein
MKPLVSSSSLFSVPSTLYLFFPKKKKTFCLSLGASGISLAKLYSFKTSWIHRLTISTFSGRFKLTTWHTTSMIYSTPARKFARTATKFTDTSLSESIRASFPWIFLWGSYWGIRHQAYGSYVGVDPMPCAQSRQLHHHISHTGLAMYGQRQNLEKNNRVFKIIHITKLIHHLLFVKERK